MGRPRERLSISTAWAGFVEQRPTVRRMARVILLVSTVSLVGFFALSSLIFQFLPGADWAIRLVWTLLLLTLFMFLRAIWPKGLMERWYFWLRTLLVIITGSFFLFLAAAGAALSTSVGALAWIIVAWFSFQGLAMIVWALFDFKASTIH